MEGSGGEWRGVEGVDREERASECGRNRERGGREAENVGELVRMCEQRHSAET